MKKLSYILLIIIASSIVSIAQENVVCPNIEVIGPARATNTGGVLNFSVLLDKDAEKLDLRYRWDVDKGKIFEGQGTDYISVLTDDLENETLTASVEIEGLPNSCNNEFTEVGSVIGGHPYPKDDFGELEDNDIQPRIDAFIIEIQNHPNTKGYILNYGKPKDVQKREKLMKDFIKVNKFDASRIIIQYKGEKDEIRTVFWLIPEGFDASRID